MIEADDTALMAELTEDEGCSPRLYVDTRGNHSIGVGHNLEAAGSNPAPATIARRPNKADRRLN